MNVDDVRAGLAGEGWRGFSLLRRYTAEHPERTRALARQLDDVAWERRADAEARTVRWAILADCSTANLRDPLLLESLARGVIPRQLHAPLSHFSREVRDPGGAFRAHRPDVVVLAAAPGRGSRAEGATAVDAAASGEALLDSLGEMLRVLRERGDATLLVHSFLAPEFRPLGLGDWREPTGLSERYARLNLALAERCREVVDAHLIDLAHLAAGSPGRWSSLHKTWFLGTFGIPEELASPLCREYAAVAAALRGLARKCLVVDLDDTLWGGVVGEVGADGIAIGGGHPGNIHRELQQVISRLRDGGVVLAINSRNREQDAWEAFRRPEMVLRREDFAAWRINWRDKVSNLRELSEELGLGLDSFVVLDDGPVNRSWIERQLPEVHVLPAQDPLDMLRTLSTARLFEGLGRTPEDALRARSYAAGAARRRERQDAADREAFLAELELVVTVGRASEDQLARLAQLSQRTNQFNLTTRRYNQGQLARLAADADTQLLYCSCRDRFGDEGITGLVILRLRGAEAAVDSFLLSCRVLGWGVERALAAAACRLAADAGAVALVGEYLPTAKNRQTESFYREAGFAQVSESASGSTWRLDLTRPRELTPGWIRLCLETSP